MVKTDTMDVTCAILAGGNSTRMGRPKATMEVRGRPLINHVFDKVKRIFDHVIIVSSHHSAFAGIDAPVVPDVFPMKGSLVGIASSLIHAATPYVFVLACDMPNLSEKAILYMIEEIHNEDIIIPRTKLGYEALHAIYNRSCLSRLLSNIENNVFKITTVFPYLSVRELFVADHPAFINRGRSVFTNLNTEADVSGDLEFNRGESPEVNEMTVREMTGEDIEPILTIEIQSFGSPWTKRLFEEALYSPIAANYVIITNNEVSGYLCLYTVEDEAHILNIAVRPGERRKGCASTLMGRVIEIMKEKGITQFYLEVREGNKEAIHLYNKFGFTAIGKRKKYYTDTNEDALVMHLIAGMDSCG